MSGKPARLANKHIVDENEFKKLLANVVKPSSAHQLLHGGHNTYLRGVVDVKDKGV